ncbi:MAG: hypothetical protein WC725_05180 [Patescibacteria group bacterium]|jgi:hypothetical protein
MKTETVKECYEKFVSKCRITECEDCEYGERIGKTCESVEGSFAEELMKNDRKLIIC